jgi:lysophospholipase L1-like esterase
VVGNLADFGNDPRAGVKVRATATPSVKIGDTSVHSNEPETVVTDETGAFTLTLVSLPGLWYRIQTPYANAINTVNLAGYVPDALDPTTGDPYPPGTVVDLVDVAGEVPTPGFVLAQGPPGPKGDSGPAVPGAGVARFVARASAGYAPLKIVVLGDSILAGTGATPGTTDAVSLVAAALGTQFPAATFTQSNRAVSGATTAVAGIGGNIADALADAGDLYVLGFGRNDVTADSYPGQPVQGYARERSLRYLEAVVRAIRERVPQADILFVTENPAADYSTDANMRTYQDGVRALAAAYGCELADTYAAFGTAGYSALLYDAVHPSPAGHQLYADTIMARIPAEVAPQAAGLARAALPGKGIRGAEQVDTSVGNVGWTVANGAAPPASYTQSGAGWTATYPRTTSTAGDYMEWVFTGTDFAIRVDQTAAAAPVVDVTLDGSPLFTNQPLDVLASAFQLFQFLATGLADGTHTLRITLVSGTLTWYQAAWLAGAPAVGFGEVGGLRKMLSGRYYTNPRDDAGTATVVIPGPGNVYVMPLWVPAETTFDQLACQVSTAAAGSTVTLGIYDSDANDQPRSLLVSTAALDASTPGFKSAAVAVTVRPGYVWLAALSLGGSPRFLGTLQAAAPVASSAPSLAIPLNGYYLVSSSALPPLWPSTTAVTSSPVVAARVA